METNIDKLIVIGDRVLIEPEKPTKKTKGGLLLPAGYEQKEEVQTGYVVKCGPGYVLPSLDEGENWNGSANEPRYIPIQIQPGDKAIFLLKNAIEIKYNDKRFFVIPQSGILMVEREEY